MCDKWTSVTTIHHNLARHHFSQFRLLMLNKNEDKV